MSHAAHIQYRPIGLLHLLITEVLQIRAATITAGDGEPTSAPLVMLSMAFNLLLGLVILALSVRQWLGALGGTLARVRYGFVAFAAVLKLWICWYFNVQAYLFQ
jgi:hypothetical protein